MHTIWSIPELVHTLKEISQNYWWSWTPDGPSLFRDLDPELWESSNHNARRVLEHVPPHRLAQVATDPSYLRRVGRLAEAFRTYRAAENTWAARTLSDVSAERPVAYFCAEFGIHESLPIYSGGLGLLAGDHLKSASDLGVPLVAVGLLYREGFFHQRVSRDGEQHAYYVAHDFRRLPISRMERDDGTSLLVRVPFPGRELAAAVWRVDVGRVPLYLLDTDVPENSTQDRWITARLYGGDHQTRVQQEMLLGVGGVRALRALGVDPGVFHLNEGHSAFLTLELARERVANGETFEAARAAVRELAVFTTHTPVPAGHDEFSSETVAAYLGWMRDALGISHAELMALGAEREPVDDEPAPAHGKLGMTPLSIRMSRRANGVSAKHGEVSRSMWHGLFPSLPVDDVPIAHVTNGVHARSWIAPVLASLYERYLGADWAEHLTDAAYWERVHDVPDEELWAAHQNLKERLVAYTRHRVARIALARGEALDDAERAYDLFDPRALTIGFARRFASYKRGDLLFHDTDRLADLLGDPERPVQLLFAGKSHPNDGMGKDILRNVVRLAQDPRFARWIVFLEDYDISVARHLVRGVDVWLNNPRRPQEASGTSGEKAALNGALNLSVLDGWWCEGYTGDNGWAIGGTRSGLYWKEEDRQDAESLYALLEERVVPLFYDRPAGIPRGWIHMMKRSIETLTPVYNTDRMVAEYAERFYTREGALASR